MEKKVKDILIVGAILVWIVGFVLLWIGFYDSYQVVWIMEHFAGDGTLLGRAEFWGYLPYTNTKYVTGLIMMIPAIMYGMYFMVNWIADMISEAMKK